MLRSLSHALVALAFLLLPGCISIPRSLADHITAEGALMTSVMRFGPVVLVRTASVIPGDTPGKYRQQQPFHCSRGSIEVELVSSPGAQGALGDTCNHILDAVSYGAASIGASPADLRLRVDLVPEGFPEFRRSRSWTVGQRPRATFALPELPAHQATLSNLVGALSHEAVHLFGALQGLPEHVAGSERLGHLVGACATLALLGELDARSLGTGDFERGPALPGHVRRSSTAGAKVGRELRALFGGQERLRADSEAGSRMIAFCRSEIPAISGRRWGNG